jgi:hypothetical protein
MGNFRDWQKITFFSVLFLTMFLTNVHSAERLREELIVVQTISKNRRSFVVDKGVKDGVFKNQEIVFGNENVSIHCKAQEVNRDYSLWVPIGENVNIPFKKDEFISYNPHTYGNVALEIIGNVNNIIPPNYSELYKKFRTSNNLSVKGSINRGLSQSSSDVSADQNSSRTGYTFTMEYNYRFLPEFEMSFGGRIDNEVYRVKNPELDIPTRRIIGTVAITYHFVSLISSRNNFYVTVAAGIGESKTTVSGDVSSGRATLLPEARIGHIIPLSKSIAMVLEGSLESITATEKFTQGTEQVTSMMNARFTIGLRF